jgi:hypothetical protein
MKEYLAKCKKTGELYRILAVFTDGVICEIVTHHGDVYTEFMKSEEFELVEKEIDKFKHTYVQHVHLWRLRYELNKVNKFSEEEFDSKLDELYEKLKDENFFKTLQCEKNGMISQESYNKFLQDCKEAGIDFNK